MSYIFSWYFHPSPLHCVTDAFTAQRRLSEVGHTCATVFSFCFEEESAGVMAAEALNVKAEEEEEEEEELLGPVCSWDQGAVWRREFIFTQT